MKLYVGLTAMMHLPDKGSITRGRDNGVSIEMPNYIYVIEHEKGLCLVDCGVEITPREKPAPGGDAVSQLRLLGYSPSDVRYVILTHMHLDHIYCMDRFPDATFIVRKEELKMAWWPDKCEGGYKFEYFRNTRNFKYIQLPDDVDFDVFGDGKVVLVDTRGHSRGHQSVLLQLSDSGKIAITGDAVSLEDNLRYLIVPGICTNNGKAEESLCKLQHYEDIGYKLFFAHEPGQKLRILPEYYD